MEKVVERMMSEGAGDAEILRVLTGSGWGEKRVRAEISRWTRTSYGPVRGPGHNIRLTVRSVVVITLLMAISWNLCDLGFSLIDAWLPDPLRQTRGPHWRFDISWPVANLIVLCPLLYGTTRKMGETHPDTSSVAKVIVSAVIAGGVIALVHGWMSGHGTLRFTAKCAFVMIVALLSGIATREERDA